MARVYDQLWEINNLRTVWANGLRRDARIYVAAKGTLDEEGKAILAENRDQSIVELDISPGDDARNAIVPLVTNTFSPDYSIYKAEIRADLDRGSVMAPFTRGTATNATATEIAALTQYAASEIGRLARFFHRSVEYCAEIYQALTFHLLMTNEGKNKEVVLIDGRPRVLTPDVFSGKFKFVFSDQASSPVTTAVKKAALIQLIPIMEGLGVPQQELAKYLIKLFDMPEEFIPPTAEAPDQEGVAQGLGEDTGSPTEVPEGIPVGGGKAAAMIRASGQDTIAAGLEEA